MEVYSHKTWNTIQEEVELEEDSLNNSCLVLTGGLDGAGEINVRDIEGVSFSERGEGGLGNLLVKARAASDINVFLAW